MVHLGKGRGTKPRWTLAERDTFLDYCNQLKAIRKYKQKSCPDQAVEAAVSSDRQPLLF